MQLRTQTKIHKSVKLLYKNKNVNIAENKNTGIVVRKKKNIKKKHPFAIRFYDILFNATVILNNFFFS